MSYLMAAIIGLLVAVAVMQILHRDAIRVVVGIYILWNATNLLIIGVASVWGPGAPILEEKNGGAMADPLVQVFVLTAIVITFGFTALLVAITSWLSSSGDSIDILDFQEDHD
jgi:multicomponent Na+:H+ antiporter subunit C